MSRGRKQKPSPDRKRIAELEEKVFSHEKTLAHKEREVQALKARLEKSAEALKEVRWRLARLQQIVFAPPEVESPGHHARFPP